MKKLLGFKLACIALLSTAAFAQGTTIQSPIYLSSNVTALMAAAPQDSPAVKCMQSCQRTLSSCLNNAKSSGDRDACNKAAVACTNVCRSSN